MPGEDVAIEKWQSTRSDVGGIAAAASSLGMLRRKLVGAWSTPGKPRAVEKGGGGSIFSAADAAALLKPELVVVVVSHRRLRQQSREQKRSTRRTSRRVKTRARLTATVNAAPIANLLVPLISFLHGKVSTHA